MHYKENNPRIDLYFFPFGRDDQSTATRLVFNSGKEIFWIDYVYKGDKMHYGGASYEYVNKYFKKNYLCLSWTWDFKKTENLELPEIKGVAGYIWRNIIVMVKKCNKNVQEVIDEISVNITDMNICKL